MGLANPDFKRFLEAQLEEAKQQVRASGHWENPTIEYSREKINLPEGSSIESDIWVSQRIDIAGVKHLQKKAASIALQEQEFRNRFTTHARISQLRKVFYSAIANKEKLEGYNFIIKRLEIAATTIEQRVDKGDASKFEALRIKNEITLIKSKKKEIKTRWINETDKLFSLLALEKDQQKLSGVLLPNNIEARIFNVGQHPKIKLLTARKHYFETRVKTAKRERWPGLTLAIGHKKLSEANLNASGNAFALGVEVPLLDRGQGYDKVALSRANQTQSRLQLDKRELQTQYNALQNSFRENHNSALQLRNLIENKKSSLSYLAEASYHAGELSVMTLIDAYKADLAAKQNYISAAIAARLDYIQLQQMRGE